MKSRDDVDGGKYSTIEEMAAKNKLRELDPSVKTLLQFDPDALSDQELNAIATIMRAQQYIKKINKAQESLNRQLRTHITNKNSEGVREALRLGANANTCYRECLVGMRVVPHEISALGFALYSGMDDIAKLLICEGKADVAEIEKTTTISLLRCVVQGSGSVELVRLLIEAGANIRPSTDDTRLESPLECAVRRGRYHLIDALSDGGTIHYKVCDGEITEKLLVAEFNELLTTNESDRYQALLIRMNKEMESIYEISNGSNVRNLVRGILIERLTVLEKQLAGEKDRGVVEKVKEKLEYISKNLNVIQARDGGKPKTAMEKLLRLINVLNGRLGNMVSGNPNAQYGRSKPQKQRGRDDAKGVGQKITVYKQS